MDSKTIRENIELDKFNMEPILKKEWIRKKDQPRVGICGYKKKIKFLPSAYIISNQELVN